MNTTFARRSLPWMLGVLLVWFWLSGCGGPTTVTALRQNPYRVYSFEVPADCETTFQRIARRAREQYQLITIATSQPGVSARLAPDGQSAVVTLFNAGGFDLEYLLSVDLHALDSGRTAVDAYCANQVGLKEALVWQQWANIPLDADQKEASPQGHGSGTRDPIDRIDHNDPNDLKTRGSALPSPASPAGASQRVGASGS